MQPDLLKSVRKSAVARERKLRAAALAVDEFRAVCLAARAEGFTLAEIATAAGVSRQRIHQLLG